MSLGTKLALYGLSTRRMLGLVDFNGSSSGGVVGVKLLSYDGKKWVKVLVDGQIKEVDQRYLDHGKWTRGFTHKELSQLRSHVHHRRVSVLVEHGHVYLRSVNRDVYPWVYDVVRQAPSDAVDHHRSCDYEDEASRYFNLLKT